MREIMDEVHTYIKKNSERLVYFRSRTIPNYGICKVVKLYEFRKGYSRSLRVGE